MWQISDAMHEFSGSKRLAFYEAAIELRQIYHSYTYVSSMHALVATFWEANDIKFLSWLWKENV